LSGRGLCDELITRPEESYRLCCVVVCDLETSRMGAPYIYDITRLRVNKSNCLSSCLLDPVRGKSNPVHTLTLFHTVYHHFQGMQDVSFCIRRSLWLTDLQLVSKPYGPDAPRHLLMVPLCPISIYGIPVALLKLQMAPRLILLKSSGSKKKEPRYTCLNEVKASHSQRMLAEISSSAHTSCTLECLTALRRRLIEGFLFHIIIEHIR